jgi:hypothetical protein
MAIGILTQKGNFGKDWEERCYQQACELARKESLKQIKEMDDKLFQNLPPGWKVVSFRKRTIKTRFGDLTISRHLETFEEGNYHFLLDEHIGLENASLATPSLQEEVVSLASVTSFREVASIIEKLTGGVISAMTIHRLFQRAAERAIASERVFPS